jgi:hypothetical protein
VLTVKYLRNDEVEIEDKGASPKHVKNGPCRYARLPSFHPAPPLGYFGELQPSHLPTKDRQTPTILRHTTISITTLGTQYCIMAVDAPNPLISTQKSSDSGLQVALHPLVLLTISDYITRHTLRRQKGPVVGALLGQQNGREITIEHAFECLLAEAEDEIVLNQTWFEERLQQSKIYRNSLAVPN